VSRDDRRWRYQRDDLVVVDWVTCGPCDKRAYRSRALAKRETRRLKAAGSGNLSPYLCPVDPGIGWHIGHLPAKVRNGDRTRDYLREQARRRG
jgi:hypothetical protein